MTCIRHDSLSYVGINRIRFQGSGDNFPSQLLQAPPAKIIEDSICAFQKGLSMIICLQNPWYICIYAWFKDFHFKVNTLVDAE